jgi:hypothetical protein
VVKIIDNPMSLPSSRLKNSPGEGTGPTESVICSEIMSAAGPHAAFLGYFNGLPGKSGFEASKMLQNVGKMAYVISGANAKLG